MQRNADLQQRRRTWCTSNCVPAGAHRALTRAPWRAAIQLTRDHRASDADEQVRILALGGWVSDPSGGDDSARVNDVLEVTRGLGDIEMKAVIRPDADVAHHELAAADEFVIIASDGLWDVISNDEAVRCPLPPLPTRTQSSQPVLTASRPHREQPGLSASSHAWCAPVSSQCLSSCLPQAGASPRQRRAARTCAPESMGMQSACCRRLVVARAVRVHHVNTHTHTA